MSTEMTDAEFDAVCDASFDAGSDHIDAVLDVLFEQPEYAEFAVADGALVSAMSAWLALQDPDTAREELLAFVAWWADALCDNKPKAH